uniref:Outer membrane lipoprotein A n=1 Tax=Actinobacillus pleuropneumoniae serovar 13 str. N273 TaxID=754262 RepID=H8Y1G4_ACTPL|nr:outer membrane lipoprotein A [Actinobacillus pleuropneumoniae serovar 13 str. N273]
MNIATKLIAGLVAGLGLTACSGGGSSGSSSKPNSKPTPKVDMSAPKAAHIKKEEVPPPHSPKTETPNSLFFLMIDNPKVEKQKENNLQEKSPKADEPQVMDPKLGAPQKDDQKLEEPKNKSNAEILKELGIKDFLYNHQILPAKFPLSYIYRQAPLYLLIIHSSKLERKNKKNNYKKNQNNRTSIDGTGKLFGHYGYIQLNRRREGERYGIIKEDVVKHNLLSMEKSTKTAPNKSIEYRGKMLYGYKNVDNRNLVADVQASYNHSDKKLSMEIFGDHGDYWKLGAIGNNRLPKDMVTGVVVDKDGTISNAGLYSKIDNTPGKLTPDATFSGGIFGKNGDVLAGSADGNFWQGVIGATATEANKK